MIGVGPKFHLPPEKAQALHRAERVSWASIIFLSSIIVAIALVMGNSQAMKALWVEDMLSLVPSVSFLVGVHFRRKGPDEAYPYGYRRAVLMGFLCGAVALFCFGSYMFIDSLVKLLEAEHPSIQTIGILGRRVWLGWLMVPTLIYSVIPPLVLGRMKLPLAHELHDKVLHVSATLDKGDWMSGLAGVLGILGIGYGWWWADSVAAGFISIGIIKDGWNNLRNSLAQLMNKRPTDIETKEPDPVIDAVQRALQRLDWIKEARVRLREDGDVITGEAFVVPRCDHDLLPKLEQATQLANSVDWRLHDINLVLVRSVRGNGKS
jgi:divalent metal cation (Fe/Co/Zn/Cd) transporter